MARRASSSPHPLRILLASAIVLGLLVGGWLLFSRANDSFRTLAVLPVSDYMENANSLRGNTYRLDGTVSRVLGWSPTVGRLFSVDVSGEVLSVLVPPELERVNIERGQRLQMRLEVAEKGLLRVTEVRKA